MITIKRNKTKPQAPIATLGDLYRFVETCDLPAGRKAQIKSAVKRTDELAGHGALDLAADPVKLLVALDEYSPAMAGMSDGGFANLKSRLRAAFKLARPYLTSTRNVRLEGEWLGLHEQLATKEQRELSRFLRFACIIGWQLAEIGDDHVTRFAAHLRDEAMVASWERGVRETIRAWNRIVPRYPALGLQPLGAGERTARLWIDRWGEPMSEAAIRAQIKFNTANAFGRHIWPHLFRAIAVTGLVDEAPEEIGITPDLLGHASVQTTSRHYILASATRAHQRVQTSFLEGRAEALRRLRDERRAAPSNDEQPGSRIRIVRKGSKHG